MGASPSTEDVTEILSGWQDRDGDMPWRITRTSPDTTLFLLREPYGPCELYCRFCPHGWETDRPPPRHGADDQATVQRAFEAALEEHPTPGLFLVSADILSYPGLTQLLDAATAAGRQVTLGTPGLSLDDPARVAQLAAYGVRIDMTVVSTTDATYERIVRNPMARKRIQRALGNLRAAHVPVDLSIVVVKDNVHELPEILRHLQAAHGAEHVHVRLFYPDIDDGPDAYFPQFPDFEVLHQRLTELDQGGLDLAMTLGNLPLCQLDPRAYPSLQLHIPAHAAHQNTHKNEGTASCASCALRERCVRLHPAYRGTVRPIDIEATKAWLDTPATTADPAPPAIARGIAPSEGIPRGQGILPGQGRPRGSGWLPGEAPFPATEDAAQAHDHGIPKNLGTLPDEGIPKHEGILPGQAPHRPTNQRVPRGKGVLPGQGLARGKGRPPTPRPPRAPQDTRHGRRYPMLRLTPPGTDPIRHAAFSPCGGHLFVLRGGRRVRVVHWDLTQRRPISRWRDMVHRFGWGTAEGVPRRTVLTVKPHGDARAIAVSEHHVWVRAERTGAAVLSQHPWRPGDPSWVTAPGEGRVMSWSGAGDTWLVGGHGLVMLTARGRFLRRLLPTHVEVVQVQPTSSYRALARLADGSLRLVHLDGRGDAYLPSVGAPTGATISSRGTWLATLSDTHVTIWDLRRRRKRWSRPSGEALRHIAITPDERHLICTGGRDDVGQTLRLWNIDAGMRRADLIAHDTAVDHLTMAPGGRRVATSTREGELILWDLTPEISRNG